MNIMNFVGTVMLTAALGTAAAGYGETVPQIIVDTDLGSSTDDLFVFEVVKHLEQAGKVKLIGAIVDRPAGADRQVDPYLAFAEAMMHYYEWDGVPIGTVPHVASTNDEKIVFTPYHKLSIPCELWGEAPFPPPASRSGAVTNAVALYRRLLASAEDKSVQIIAVGFFAPLKALLESAADDISPLTGLELIENKVAALRIMAGNFDFSVPHPEYNAWGDVAATRAVFTRWPGRVVVSPFEVGQCIYYPRKPVLADFNDRKGHPIYLTYSRWDPDGKDEGVKSQLMWDPATILGLLDEIDGCGWFDSTGPGDIEVYDVEGVDGYTRFIPGSQGRGEVQLLDEVNAPSVRAYLRTFGEDRAVNPFQTEIPLRLHAIAPASVPGGEFVVLTNHSDTVTVDLDGIRLVISEPEIGLKADWTFPEGATLAPGATVKLTAAENWPGRSFGEKSVNIVLWSAGGDIIQELFFDFRSFPDRGNRFFVITNSTPLVLELTDWRLSNADETRAEVSGAIVTGDDDTDCVIANFQRVAAVPRRSHHEEQISRWLYDWAKGMDFGVITDEHMNVVMDVPATPGWEKCPLVALQTHMDMVAAWETGTSHDWDHDPIVVAAEKVDDVWYLCSSNHLTSLGADDGIGIATAMAVAQGRVDHGPVRILVTTDEEETQTGAKGLSTNCYNDVAALINIDSEDDGVVTISSAASDDEVITATPSVVAPQGQKAFLLQLGGFRGGHSGVDIGKGRLSAIRELAAVLTNLTATAGCEIAHFNGGNAANAIPTFANSIVVVPEDRTGTVADCLSAALADFINRGETAATFTATESGIPEQVMSAEFRDRLLGFVNGIINGIHSMSAEVPGLVESSSNLGLLTANCSELSIKIMARSSNDTKSQEITADHRARAEAAGFDYSACRNCYPWPADPASRLLQVVTNSWKTVFGDDMKVEAIHAGLECGYFKFMVPSLDVVSIGPTVVNPHTVEEVCRIDTIGKQLKLLREVFANMQRSVERRGRDGLLVFDCDPGTDDSVSLFLLSQHGVVPDMIISTFGNMPGAYTHTNAWLMANYCGLTNSTMLVAGAQRPYVGPDPSCGDFHGPDGLAGLAPELTARFGVPSVSATLNEALAVIGDSTNVTYIAVGPLTSLSQLLDRDPGIASRFKDVLVMGGGIREFNKEVGTKDLEYNFAADGIAVTNVFASALPLTLFPLDITFHHANVEKAAVDAFLASGKFPEISVIIATNYSSNVRYAPGIDWSVLHDTLPSLYYLNPEPFTMTDMLLAANEYGHIDVSDGGRSVKVGVSLPDRYLEKELRRVFAVFKSAGSVYYLTLLR